MDEKQSSALIFAYKEIASLIEIKGKQAAELLVANIELALQNKERADRAAELIIANKELVFQNEEKSKRASELVIANTELAFQNKEKEDRAAELIIANKELIFQNEEKSKRASELAIANEELAFQNEEKEKRTEELVIANKELEQFAYIASHDLQEPLRTVSNYMKVLEDDYLKLLDENAFKYIHAVNNAIKRMSTMIKSLLHFSRLGRNAELHHADCKVLIDEVISDLGTLIKTSKAVIEVTQMPRLNIYEVEMRQLFQNLITNAIKFQKKDIQPRIRISSEEIDGQWCFSVSDNGIGIDPIHFNQVFDIFQRLNTQEAYEGTGIGLANCKKIVQLHKGKIWIESIIGKGATFHFNIPI